jgi:beta-phosphoglucomutase family hydrolase
MPARIKALVFDMDGTLVDNMRDHEQAWVEFFKRRGRAIEPEAFFRQTAGRHNREIMRDWIDPQLTDAELLALAEEKESLYRALYAPKRQVLAGFTAFAAAAKARGLRLAVATSAPPANIDFILDPLDLRQHFDVVVGAQNVKRGKPHPDIYLLAAQELGLAPDACIAFEDAPAGVQSAAAAGMRCVALTTYLPAHKFAGEPNVIASVPDFTHLAVESLLTEVA